MPFGKVYVEHPDILRCAFDLPALPNTISAPWDSWIPRFDGKMKKLVLVGIAGLCWVIWNTRNDACFRNIKEANKNLLLWGTRLVDQVAREVFEAARGWNTMRRRIAGWQKKIVCSRCLGSWNGRNLWCRFCAGVKDLFAVILCLAMTSFWSC